MNNLAQLYNRRFALHLRVKALACQLAELENLRDRVVRAEQRTLCTTRLAENALRGVPVRRCIEPQLDVG
jgi:hypothetical protein